MTVCIALIRYIGLVSYSESGVRMTKDIAARVEQTKTSLQSAGAEVTVSHITLGRYDALMVLEFPNEEMMSRLDAVIRESSARIEILRALSPGDLDRILALPT
jgi:uncharacterized protein with GYD domain